MLWKCFSQPACVCSRADFINRICAGFAAPSLGSPGAVLEARTLQSLAGLFIYCLWPGAGAAWGLHSFPPARALPILSQPQCCLHSRGPPSPSPAPDSGRRPPVVWGWRRRGGTRAQRARVLPHPALTGGMRPVGKAIPTCALGTERGWAADLKLQETSRSEAPFSSS